MAKYHPQTNSSSQNGRFKWVVLGIFTLALIVRILHIWQIYKAPFFPLLFGDVQSYDAWAREIAASDWEYTGGQNENCRMKRQTALVSIKCQVGFVENITELLP